MSTRPMLSLPVPMLFVLTWQMVGPPKPCRDALRDSLGRNHDNGALRAQKHTRRRVRERRVLHPSRPRLSTHPHINAPPCDVLRELASHSW